MKSIHLHLLKNASMVSFLLLRYETNINTKMFGEQYQNNLLCSIFLETTASTTFAYTKSDGNEKNTTNNAQRNYQSFKIHYINNKATFYKVILLDNTAFVLKQTMTPKMRKL